MEKNKPRRGYLEPRVEIIKLQEQDLIQTSSELTWEDGVLDDGWT